MKTYFDHEKLDVYREAIAFCGWAGEFLNGISGKAAMTFPRCWKNSGYL